MSACLCLSKDCMEDLTTSYCLTKDYAENLAAYFHLPKGCT